MTYPPSADAPTLDELLEKVSRMALDVAPDNLPGVGPESHIHPSYGAARSHSRGGVSGAAV